MSAEPYPSWMPWRKAGPSGGATSGPAEQAWQRLGLHWHVHRKDSGAESEPDRDDPERARLRHSLVEHNVRDYPLIASLATPEAGAAYIAALLETIRAAAEADPLESGRGLETRLDDWYADRPARVAVALARGGDHADWYPRKLAPVTPSSPTWSTALTARVYIHPVQGVYGACPTCATVRR